MAANKIFVQLFELSESIVVVLQKLGYQKKYTIHKCFLASKLQVLAENEKDYAEYDGFLIAVLFYSVDTDKIKGENSGILIAVPFEFILMSINLSLQS